MPHDLDLVKEIYSIKTVITFMISIMNEEQQDMLKHLTSSLGNNDTDSLSVELREHLTEVNALALELVKTGSTKFD